ncbi:IS110 family transposase, partial [Chryseobacterium pennae]
MKTYFIGIDISKDTLDVCILNDSDEKELAFKVSNTVEGIEEMIALACCSGNDSSHRYCFENTGNYGLLLASLLEERQLLYYQVPALEIKLSQGIQRGKNDKVDAWRIARYAKMHEQELIPSALSEEVLFTIKNFLTYRNFLIKVRTQFKNEKKA